uniref:Si:dkey-243k1.3 n=1 Tax=Neolamprologus brichardi TaxID=32507 RepID=A0A3Q4MFJ0_NEOBR
MCNRLLFVSHIPTLPASHLSLFWFLVQNQTMGALIKCKQFFYNKHVPKWTSNHVHICQKYKDSYHFATLYDTTNRIPVYSAYVVEDNKETERHDTWMVEPQLVNEEFEEVMMTEDSLKEKHPKLDPKEIGTKQATDDDYNKRPDGYSRGHLNPSSHHAGKRATYTLTNIVPQNHELNQGLWSQHEAKLKRLAKDNKMNVYVLVGAIPSERNWIKRDNQPGVNIPEYMWVAYCYCDKKSCKSGGATAKNDENNIDEFTLSELHNFLKNHKKIAGQLFDNKCYVE